MNCGPWKVAGKRTRKTRMEKEGQKKEKWKKVKMRRHDGSSAYECNVNYARRQLDSSWLKFGTMCYTEHNFEQNRSSGIASCAKIWFLIYRRIHHTKIIVNEFQSWHVRADQSHRAFNGPLYYSNFFLLTQPGTDPSNLLRRDSLLKATLESQNSFDISMVAF